MSTQSPKTIPPVPNETIPNAITHQGFMAGEDGEVVTLSPELSNDAASLHRLLLRQARVPPRPILTLRGTHKVHSRPNCKDHKRNACTTEDHRQEVVDFSFAIDLSPYLLPDIEQSDHEKWRELHVGGDEGDAEPCRGGHSPSRESTSAPSANTADGEEDTLLVSVDKEKPTGESDLMVWCERYCQDTAGVKSFAFRRRIRGFRRDILEAALTSLLRSVDYRGHVSLSTSITNRTVVVYSPHWINQLRNNAFAWWFFTVSFLWIITWPIIKLVERPYTVVESNWYFSRNNATTKTYIRGLDEVEVAQDLAPVVTQAAWERRKDGRVLSGQEIRLLRQLEQERRDSGR